MKPRTNNFRLALAVCSFASFFVPSAAAMQSVVTMPPQFTLVTDDDASTMTAQTLALIQDLEARHATINTVTLDFRQEKVTEFFEDDVLKSSGKIWFSKPDYFRVDYAPPNEYVMLINRQIAYQYSAEIEQLERFVFASTQERDQQIHALMLGFDFRVDVVTQNYKVTSSSDDEALAAQLSSAPNAGEGLILLEFIPLPALMETSQFLKLQLWIDKSTLLPQKVWIEDHEGSKTTFVIVASKLNEPIESSIYDIAEIVPDGITIIDR